MKDNRRGVLLVIVSMAIFSLQDTSIKLLSTDISLFQILFYHSVIGIVLISAYLKITRQPLVFSTVCPLLSTLRGLLFFFACSAFYFSQSQVPIANATVLFLVSPFFITIMSIIVFARQVEYSRWLTMLVGFSA